MVITAIAGGLIYINGHFAGEAGADMPLMRAVNPTGAVFIEYHPLDTDFRSLAMRLVFSGGMPMAESAAGIGSVRIVAWHGGITEIELIPPETVPPAPLFFDGGGRQFVIDGQGRLMLEGKRLAQLPPDAEPPVYQKSGHGAVLLGRCREGMYLVSGDDSFSVSNGFLSAKRIEIENGGRIRALTDPHDTVGHGFIENWRLEEDGLRLVSSESVWVDGAPRWPQTPLQAVCAAIEAGMAGLHGEAEGYLSPALRSRSPLGEICDQYDFCTEMKYGLPEGRSCAALIRLEGEAMARAVPLYYRCSPSGGAQGAYQIDALDLG